MSRIARKGLSATLLVCMLAAPVTAAAAPAERPEGRAKAAAADWVGGVVVWLGGWLIDRFGVDAPEQGTAGDVRARDFPDAAPPFRAVFSLRQFP